MFAPEQVAETERRFADRTVVRDQTIKAIETIGPLAANPPDRIALRKARLEETLALPTEVTVAGISASTARPGEGHSSIA